MRFLSLFIFCFIYLSSLKGQNAAIPSTKKWGVYATIDITYGTSSKLFKSAWDRKLSYGLSYVHPKKRFQILAGVGAKIIKYNISPYRFSNTFIADIKRTYKPIPDTSESQLIGSMVNNGENLKFGTLNYFVHIGLIYHHKLKPAFHFYYGEQLTMLKDHRLAQYTDPEHGDFYQVAMPTRYYELKLGLTIPLKFFKDKPFCYNITFGYRFMDHKNLSFDSTPLSAYTRENLTELYRYDSKWLIGINFNFWSNWKYK